LVSASTEPDFGRWLPQDRFSLDQVPCNMVEGDMRTYNEKGDKVHVWVAGAGNGDESKRYCTLQLVVCFVNGDTAARYRGQPWPEICFRGKGMRISQREKDAWHPKVWVRFQPKAWYDAETCNRYATERFPTITSEARRQNRESVLLTDNLHGQTTDDFKEALWTLSRTKVHLLPAGVTDLIQVIDGGFGYLVKLKMGENHSDWMIEGDNLTRWTTGMAAWEQRAHMTHMLAAGYEAACQKFDFEKVARKLGNLMTIGDEPYEGIVLQGIGPVSFTDADGGSEGVDSDSDDDDDDDTVDLSGPDEEKEEEDEDGELVHGELEPESSDDEEDDTDPLGAAAVAGVGVAVAPAGFDISTKKLKVENDIIGSPILVKLASPPLEEAEYGWYRGVVKCRASPGDLIINPSCPMIIRFKKDETMGIVPPRYNKDAKKVFATVPLPVTPEHRGITWHLLAQVPK
jgi:hypothetical protein